jgi:hypothetical protein
VATAIKGHDHVITNNWWDWYDPAFWADLDQSTCTISNNTLFTDPTALPQATLDAAGLESTYRSLYGRPATTIQQCDMHGVLPRCPSTTTPLVL